MQTFSQIIDALGGYAKAADALGVPAGTVSAWKTRGSIPSAYWHRLVNLASTQGVDGVSLETLARMSETKPAAKQDEAA